MSSTLDYVKAQLPEFADTYVRDMLSRTQALTDVNENPYQQYQGDRVAGFSPLQEQAFAGAGRLGPSTYTGEAAGIAGLAAARALNTQYQPGYFGNQYQAQPGYNAQQTGNYYSSVSPYQFQQTGNQYQATRQYDPQGFQNQFRYAQNYDPNQDAFQNQFRAPRDYQSANITTDKFGQSQAREYMSPYMQSVVDVQQREAQRQADIAATQRNAEATGKGAFGGSRQAIMDAEAARNLALQKGDIQAKGLQDAFQQAQAQFNADQGRGLTAQQATEQSRQFGAGQGLQAAGMGAQYGTAAAQAGAQARQFAANLGLQGAMGEAQYGTAAQQAAQADRQFAQQQALQNQQLMAQYGLGSAQLNAQQQQFGANLGLQNQQNMAQYGVAGASLSQADRQFAYQQMLQNMLNQANYGQQAAQLGEQSRQYGAGLGLQGLAAANTAAGTLGNLGTSWYNQTKDALGTQYALGSGQQARNQALIDTDYGNWQAAQQYPQQMLQFQSGMLNSLPMSGYGGSVTQQDAPNYGSQILGGLLTWGAGIGKAKGGVVDGRRSGLMALAASKYR